MTIEETILKQIKDEDMTVEISLNGLIKVMEENENLKKENEKLRKELFKNRGKTPIGETGLATWDKNIYHALTRRGVKYIEELSEWSEKDILGMKYIGKTHLEKLKKTLKIFNVKLKEE